ncbi:hypothetical protein NDU88_006665, partial [Pleurodeles waltl]
RLERASLQPLHLHIIYVALLLSTLIQSAFVLSYFLPIRSRLSCARSLPPPAPAPSDNTEHALPVHLFPTCQNNVTSQLDNINPNVIRMPG